MFKRLREAFKMFLMSKIDLNASTAVDRILRVRGNTEITRTLFMAFVAFFCSQIRIEKKLYQRFFVS